MLKLILILTHVSIDFSVRGGCDGGSGTQQLAGGKQESTVSTILTLTLMFLLWRDAAGAAERNNQPGLGRGRGRGRA